MRTFATLSGPAAALPMINVDTDQLIPKQYLTAISRAGLGKGLFHDFRYDMEDKEVPDFVLNRAPWREAGILIAGQNFGCGSSREHAPWALEDFGIRCVIAPSFADIFFNNCVKNGILLVTLDDDGANLLMSDAGELSDLPDDGGSGGADNHAVERRHHRLRDRALPQAPAAERARRHRHYDGQVRRDRRLRGEAEDRPAVAPRSRAPRFRRLTRP